MSERPWRVAVIDSGLKPPLTFMPIAARRFVDDGSQILELAAIDDPSGHGSVIAGIIMSSPRPVELVICQVLHEQGGATAASVAAAVGWARRQGAHLLHLSLGLTRDRAVLKASILDCLAAGMVVVASAPARGAPVYPAAYPGVIRATGDARCAEHEISCLGTEQADFGACPATHSGVRMLRGASIGAAHLSRFIATHAEPGSPAPVIRGILQRNAAHHGRERRSREFPAAHRHG